MIQISLISTIRFRVVHTLTPHLPITALHQLITPPILRLALCPAQDLNQPHQGNAPLDTIGCQTVVVGVWLMAPLMYLQAKPVIIILLI